MTFSSYFLTLYPNLLCNRKTRRTKVLRASYAWTQWYPMIPVYIILSVNQWLLDDCSNTTWSYSTSTFTISDRCITVCKWWFFVRFVLENPNFPLCPFVFWEFCYHGVITLYIFLLFHMYIYRQSYPHEISCKCLW